MKKVFKHTVALFTAVSMLAMTGITDIVHAIPAKSTGLTEMPLTQISIDVPYSCPSVYQNILALQETYPNGTPWTNDEIYYWNGGVLAGGMGCAAFAFLLSDAAFGTLPATMNTLFDAERLRVGDVLRMNMHSFIILEVKESSVIVAEGNLNGTVYWGREVTFDDIIESSFEHHLTRYPDEFAFLSDNMVVEAGSTAASDLISRNAVSLTWTSSDPNVAQVDENGLITGIRTGEAVITAQSDTHTESFTVIITESEQSATTTTLTTTTTSETTTTTTTSTTTTSTTTTVSETTATETTTSTSTIETDDGLHGDVNEDNTVDINDASIVLTLYAKKAAGLPIEDSTEEQQKAADVNNDGLIDISDATAILRYYAQNAAGLNPTWEQII
ncbi:MAG: dockerin type I domain-containing protein [Ruminococcus sp.]